MVSFLLSLLLIFYIFSISSNAFEINGSKNKGSYTSRESYQQMKKYKNVEPVPRIKKELDDFNYLYKIDDKKVYDINTVLEEARKNRQEKDKLEEKKFYCLCCWDC